MGPASFLGGQVAFIGDCRQRNAMQHWPWVNAGSRTHGAHMARDPARDAE